MPSLRIPAAIILLALSSTFAPAHAQQPQLAPLAQRIPLLNERLHSSHWQVRFLLLHDLTGHDAETKKILETLTTDENPKVAQPAMALYDDNFLTLNPKFFQPKIYFSDRFPINALPKENADQILVDYLLGNKIDLGKAPHNDAAPDLPTLSSAKTTDIEVIPSIVAVGILGKLENAKALHPFLDSTDAYIALNAAKACYRLGDKDAALKTLTRLASVDVAYLYDITQALQILKQAEAPNYSALVQQTLAATEKTKVYLQSGWLNEFLLLAAETNPDAIK